MTSGTASSADSASQASATSSTRRVERHHWLTTYVGILDGAFFLSEEEMYAVSDIVRKLLLLLDVPDRSEPTHLPLPVVQEVSAQYYTVALESRDYGVTRTVRPVTDEDCAVSLEAWREALVGLLTTAYPDLTVEETLLVTKVFTDLLANIGVPHRAAAFHPHLVINAHQDIDRVGA